MLRKRGDAHSPSPCWAILGSTPHVIIVGFLCPCWFLMPPQESCFSMFAHVFVLAASIFSQDTRPLDFAGFPTTACLLKGEGAMLEHAVPLCNIGHRAFPQSSPATCPLLCYLRRHPTLGKAREWGSRPNMGVWVKNFHPPGQVPQVFGTGCFHLPIWPAMLGLPTKF